MYDVAPNPTPPATMGETEDKRPTPCIATDTSRRARMAPASADSAGVARRLLRPLRVRRPHLRRVQLTGGSSRSDSSIGPRAFLCEWRGATVDDLHDRFAELEGVAHADAVTAVAAFSPDDRFLTPASRKSAPRKVKNASTRPECRSCGCRDRRCPCASPTRRPADGKPTRIRSASFRHVGFGPTAASGSNPRAAVLNIDGEGHAIQWDVADAGAGGRRAARRGAAAPRR